MQQDERPYHGIPAQRQALVAAGFVPPLFDKTPPVYGKNGAKKASAAGDLEDEPEQIADWSRHWPDAQHRRSPSTPALDLDILNEEAARACEAGARAFRRARRRPSAVGRPPKRAILFRTEVPFSKILGPVTAPNGGADPEKIEFLGAGQQLACFGIHPDTAQPYRWHGGEPGQIRRDDLPLVTTDEARALVADLVELLARDFGYTQPTRRAKGTAHKRGGGSDWADLFDNHAGQSLHDSPVRWPG
jgi:hypothetical protein